MIDEKFKRQLSLAIERMETFHRSVNNMVSAWQERMEQFTKSINSAFEQLSKIVETLPEDQKILHKYLSVKGWFLPTENLNIYATKKLSDLIQSEEYEQVDDWIQDFINQSIPVIKKTVKKEFSKRFDIIEAAINAHEKKEYKLSIPTLLAQADGMFHEIMNTSFYSNKKEDLEKIRRKILIKLSEDGSKATTTSFAYLMVSQLKEESVLHKSENELNNLELDESKSLFNRHMILHGKYLNYSTESNALKAIALIGFLSDCKNILGSQKVVKPAISADGIAVTAKYQS